MLRRAQQRNQGCSSTRRQLQQRGRRRATAAPLLVVLCVVLIGAAEAFLVRSPGGPLSSEGEQRIPMLTACGVIDYMTYAVSKPGKRRLFTSLDTPPFNSSVVDDDGDAHDGDPSRREDRGPTVRAGGGGRGGGLRVRRPAAGGGAPGHVPDAEGIRGGEGQGTTALTNRIESDRVGSPSLGASLTFSIESNRLESDRLHHKGPH